MMESLVNSDNTVVTLLFILTCVMFGMWIITVSVALFIGILNTFKAGGQQGNQARYTADYARENFKIAFEVFFALFYLSRYIIKRFSAGIKLVRRNNVQSIKSSRVRVD